MPQESNAAQVRAFARESAPAGHQLRLHDDADQLVTSREPQVSDLFLEHLRSINATFTDQLKVVDQKAAYVFTFLIAMMIWSEQVRIHFAHLLDPALTLDWVLSVALSASLTIAAASAILVVVPRFLRSEAPLYWGAWPEAGGRLDAERLTFNRDRAAEDYRCNAEFLAALCGKKYRLVRCSYQFLLLGIGTYLAAIAVS